MTLNISNSARFFLLASFFVFLLSIFTASAIAAPCNPVSGNEYEKIFCQLKNSGKGQSLPSIYEFRANPPMTQALLLKKPAERAGIVVNIPERESREVVYRQESLLLEVNSTPSKLEQASSPIEEKLLRLIPIPAAQLESTDWVNTCSLWQFELRCSGGRFRLTTNQPNQVLANDALEDDHKLSLPRREAAAEEDYLARAYQRYVEGMLEIGLGASTMSYTKFVNLYNRMAVQKLNFVERFETMYTFLKKDKANIGVSTKAVLAAGFNTRYCSELSENLLACEYGSDNYVFQRAAQ